MKKQRIWITGASRGIGYATALRLANSCSAMFLSARHSNEDMKMNIIDKHPNVKFIKCDVSDSKQVKSTYDSILKEAGGLDILINNAGIVIYQPMVESTEEVFDDLVNINFKGTYLTIKYALKGMIDQKSGIIINLSSIAAISQFDSSAIYSASKAAQLAMSRILRKEVRKYGIRVVDILPGATNTEMWDKESRKKAGHNMMQPKDVAEAIYKLIELNEIKGIMTEELIIRPIGGDL